MKTTIALLSCFLASACVSAVAQTSPSPALSQNVSVSQVRIVRLSQVRGEVELDRKTGQQSDTAFVNLPIVAGVALRTKQGLAEVEFEDNSSLRITPQSQVEFPRLGRDAAGATLTSVNLLQGSLYISLAGSKFGGDFTVNAGNQAIVVSPSTHLRLDLDASTARMVVFQGSATVTGPSGSTVVTRRKAISFDTTSSSAPEFVRIGDAADFDAWDKNAVDYHKAGAATVASGFTGSSGFSGSPYTYGLNDLSNYGSFSNVAGCGTTWRPYLANASFDPYGSGVWSWYPGQGYTWVSLYPWGWAPFHSGSWDYCPAGGGWGWNPQGTWRGLSNQPLKPVRGAVRPTPPAPPVRGGATLIAVNLKAMQLSQPDENGKFVFRAGSAGYGVPRGVFSNLAKISQTVENHGSATAYLSERQVEVGLLAPNRALAGASSSTAPSANRSSSAQSRGSTVTSSYSAASHSSPTSVSSVSSFTPNVSASQSVPSSPHH